MKPKKSLLSLPVFFFYIGLTWLAPAALCAEEIASSEYLFSADIPEGFFLAEGNGKDRFMFQNAVFPAELQTAVYPRGQFEKAADCLAFVLGQVGSSEEAAELAWRGRDAAISRIDFGFGKGWGFAAELPQGKGFLAVISYSYAGQASPMGIRMSGEELELFHLSALDSFLTGLGNAASPGIVATFAYPKEGEINVPFATESANLSVPLDKSDAAANQYVVDREYLVLAKYAGTPLAESAWKRFYRMIYRDAWQRLQRAAFILDGELPSDPQARALELMEWLFGFEYTRDFDGSDFTSLPEVFASKTGDCDTRCLLFVLLMRQMGQDAALLISPELSHSVAAVDAKVAGPAFLVEGKEMSAVDLTSSKTEGRLFPEMADASKWFAVTFRP